MDLFSFADLPENASASALVLELFEEEEEKDFGIFSSTSSRNSISPQETRFPLKKLDLPFGNFSHRRSFYLWRFFHQDSRLSDFFFFSALGLFKTLGPRTPLLFGSRTSPFFGSRTPQDSRPSDFSIFSVLGLFKILDFVVLLRRFFNNPNLLFFSSSLSLNLGG